MPHSELRRLMTGADAMFLYFERKKMPLHIGCVAILDGPFDEESEHLLAARLPELPRYRQRVIFSPLNLTHPSWEDDPDFDIRNHIRRVTLPPPGNERQLSELSGRVFTALMDRTRPLWDLTVVDGLEAGRSALIIRVHHSLVDGVSGVALVNIMFDRTREPRRVETQPYNPPPLPDPRQVMVEGMASFWTEGVGRLVGAQLNILRMVQAFTGESSSASWRGLMDVMPELLRPTMRLPFNGPCSGERGHCWTSTPFAEARAIRAALGGTINDVILTVVAGAVSHYVAAHREPVVGRFVRLMVPVNLRSCEQGGACGNEISMLPLSLPLDIEDPVERMKVVTARTAAMKSARVADVIALIGGWLGWTPPALQQSLAALPFLPQPVLMFNMVCTNVPGPMVPLYSNGRELLTYYPHVPCGSDVGISVAASSYNQNLYYGITYDCQAAPDGELFRDFMIQAYEELRSAAGLRPVPPAREPAATEAVPSPPEANISTEPEPAAAISDEPITAADAGGEFGSAGPTSPVMADSVPAAQPATAPKRDEAAAAKPRESPGPHPGRKRKKSKRADSAVSGES